MEMSEQQITHHSKDRMHINRQALDFFLLLFDVISLLHVFMMHFQSAIVAFAFSIQSERTSREIYVTNR